MGRLREESEVGVEPWMIRWKDHRPEARNSDGSMQKKATFAESRNFLQSSFSPTLVRSTYRTMKFLRMLRDASTRLLSHAAQRGVETQTPMI